jgi:glycerate kinase
VTDSPGCVRPTAVRHRAGIPITILVAPDSFKGTFRAADVAAAIGRGLEAGGTPVDLCPVADGGEGTLELLMQALGGAPATAEVTDPLGRKIEANLGLIAGGRGRARPGTLAIVEAAAASGLGLVAPHERDAEAASTYGTGQLIAAAVAAGARLVLLGVGGTATTDGGAGAIRAIRKAAGGLAGGLWAAFGAELVAGSSFILDELDFDARMRRARAVVTGEGKLDQQSLAGKAVSEIATRARQSGVPCHAIVGTRELDAFGLRMLDLEVVLEAPTLAEIESAGRELAGLI